MTARLVAARYDDLARVVYLRVLTSNGELLDGTVEITSDRHGIVVFEGLNEFKERVGGNRLDVDVSLNRLCSAIIRGQLPALPIDLEWA